MVPELVGKNNLRAGNAISQGTSQLAQFVGPVLAGGLIAWAGHNLHLAGGSTSTLGLQGVALAFDALTFLVSVVTLWMIDAPVYRTTAEHEKVLVSISSILQFV